MTTNNKESGNELENLFEEEFVPEVPQRKSVVDEEKRELAEAFTKKACEVKLPFNMKLESVLKAFKVDTKTAKGQHKKSMPKSIHTILKKEMAKCGRTIDKNGKTAKNGYYVTIDELKIQPWEKVDSNGDVVFNDELYVQDDNGTIVEQSRVGKDYNWVEGITKFYDKGDSPDDMIEFEEPVNLLVQKGHVTAIKKLNEIK
jgi:hypothetical protein